METKQKRPHFDEDNGFFYWAKNPELPYVISGSEGSAERTMAMLKISYDAGYSLALKWKDIVDDIKDGRKVAILCQDGLIVSSSAYREATNKDLYRYDANKCWRDDFGIPLTTNKPIKYMEIDEYNN